MVIAVDVTPGSTCVMETVLLAMYFVDVEVKVEVVWVSIVRVWLLPAL